jgi:hypothetical protein
MAPAQSRAAQSDSPTGGLCSLVSPFLLLALRFLAIVRFAACPGRESAWPDAETLLGDSPDGAIRVLGRVGDVATAATSVVSFAFLLRFARWFAPAFASRSPGTRMASGMLGMHSPFLSSSCRRVATRVQARPLQRSARWSAPSRTHRGIRVCNANIAATSRTSVIRCMEPF